MPGSLQQHGPTIRALLLAGTYRPSLVKRVEIPKPGGVRKLGMPTVLHLIDRSLKAGALTGDGFEATTEGTPQGGPLSPRFATLLLDGFDKELERRRLKFTVNAINAMFRPSWTVRQDFGVVIPRRKRCGL